MTSSSSSSSSAVFNMHNPSFVQHLEQSKMAAKLESNQLIDQIYSRVLIDLDCWFNGRAKVKGECCCDRDPDCGCDECSPEKVKTKIEGIIEDSEVLLMVNNEKNQLSENNQNSEILPSFDESPDSVRDLAEGENNNNNSSVNEQNLHQPETSVEIETIGTNAMMNLDHFIQDGWDKKLKRKTKLNCVTTTVGIMKRTRTDNEIDENNENNENNQTLSPLNETSDIVHDWAEGGDSNFENDNSSSVNAQNQSETIEDDDDNLMQGIDPETLEQLRLEIKAEYSGMSENNEMDEIIGNKENSENSENNPNVPPPLNDTANDHLPNTIHDLEEDISNDLIQYADDEDNETEIEDQYNEPVTSMSFRTRSTRARSKYKIVHEPEEGDSSIEENDDDDDDDSYEPISDDDADVSEFETEIEEQISESGDQGHSSRSKSRRSRAQNGPYPCRECGKQYATKRSLRNHTYHHTGKWPFKCADCGLGFASKDKVEGHARIHTGDFPYPCPECDKRFRTAALLKGHSPMHSEEPFTCGQCKAKFKWKHNLKQHILAVHERVRPHKCSQCERSFATSAHLKVHQQRTMVHTKVLRKHPDFRTVEKSALIVTVGAVHGLEAKNVEQ